MLNSMEPKTKQLFIFHDSSQKLWEAVNTHFSQKKEFSSHLPAEERDSNPQIEPETHDPVHQRFETKVGGVQSISGPNH
jgi:hypothetical protein